MKLAITFLSLSLLFTIQANAKAKIPVCFPCEYIETTTVLPEDSEFIGEYDDQLNVGYKYDQINLLWIPIWNYEGQYCLVNAAEDTYYDITDEDKAILTETYGANLEGNPLSIWSKIGGKLIILIILGLVVKGMLSSKDDEDENVATEPSSTQA
ncbi:hypothetical protein [Crocinitomix catalasitica]|uniref:hypothetical protein n=1 Tax=Crocinitomix catalasitica TaxID=184607 RepID=UPI000482B26E|nr:hypothetical protein [Crocinitomix catalasitica]